MSNNATNPAKTGGQVYPMVMQFFPADTVPAYGNESQYLLLVACDQSECEPGESHTDELLWGLWHESEWWILNDSLEIPFPDEAFEQDKEINEVVSFVKFSGQEWFTLKGWTNIWGGVGNVRFQHDNDDSA